MGIEIVKSDLKEMNLSPGQLLKYFLISAILGILSGALTGNIPLGLLFQFISLAGIIDLKTRVVPDSMLFLYCVIGFLISIIYGRLQDSIVGFLLGGGSLLLVGLINQGGIGGGDIKIAAVLGIWLGGFYITFVLLISTILLFVYCLGLKTIKRNANNQPFVSFMALGFLVFMLGAYFTG